MIPNRDLDPFLAAPAPSRRRGRPSLMSRDALVDRISALARRQEGLFRIHRTHGSLYARARREFGSWAAAVRAAGCDYDQTMSSARRRASESRRKRLRARARPRF